MQGADRNKEVNETQGWSESVIQMSSDRHFNQIMDRGDAFPALRSARESLDGLGRAELFASHRAQPTPAFREGRGNPLFCRVEAALANAYVAHYSPKDSKPRGRPRNFELRLCDADPAQSTACGRRWETLIVGN